MSASTGLILVVEDDAISRRVLQMTLSRQGYQVITTENAAQAQAHLAPDRLPAIACVITDYLMPGANGLELMAWIHEQDPGLATILVTAKNDKELIADSLRGGAVDFLEKPVDVRKLHAAVIRAVAQTRHQRHLAQSASSVRQLGLTQQRLLDAESGRAPGILRVYSHPKHDAGGDFFTHFRPTANQICCLLTDVSGHDVQAAYLSAYFQGLARGLLSRGADLAAVFQDLNRFLLDELNLAESAATVGSGVETSVAVCGLLVDFAAAKATVITLGTPPPIYLPPLGNVLVLGGNEGTPLGWFPELALQTTTQPIDTGGLFYLWTDGLEELATAEDVSSLCLAAALQNARACGKPLACLANAGDDILLAVVEISSTASPARDHWPLICERYHGGQSADIDRLQSRWRRSLLLAVPDLSDGQLHDLLLASREAVLNALQHGCRGCADQWALFQVDHSQSRQAVRITVSDPGPGHQFDLAGHEQMAARELLSGHRGLILMKNLANQLQLKHNGACVVMDFCSVQPSLKP